jgi:hypothetical protein
MDVDLDEWPNEIMNRACNVIVKYEAHLRSKDSLPAAKGLARAMRELKEVVPEEILEIKRG